MTWVSTSVWPITSCPSVPSPAWGPVLDQRIRLWEGLRDELDSCIGCGCLSIDRCRLRNPGDRAALLGPGPRYLLRDGLVA